MLIAYIVSMIVGGALVVMSAITGHGHHEASFDHGGDADHGGGDHDTWIPFLSLRFWMYGLTAFGLSGILLLFLAKQSVAASVPWSIGTGLICGLIVSYITRLAMKSEADSSAKTQDMLGKSANVLVPIRPGLPGKVRFSVKGEWIELLALPQENESIEANEEVIILNIERDRAYVMKKSALME